jgi:hypothetical protein
LVFWPAGADEMTELLPGHFSPLHLGDGRILVVDTQGRLLSARIDPATGTVQESPTVRLEGISVWNGIAAAHSIADDGTYVFATGGAEVAGSYLGWLDLNGRFTPITSRPGVYEIDSFVSPDGRFLAVEIPGDETTIAIHDIDRDVQSELVPGAPIAFPVWSPDSTEVAYRQITDEQRAIYRAPVDRSSAPTLIYEAPEERFALPTDWSPDGSVILYVDSRSRTRQPDGGNDLFLLPLDGSDVRPFLATPASEIDGRFSPDGNWIAYASNQSGRYEIYVRPLTGTSEFRISAEGGESPEWNPAGGELYFQRGDDIYVADIDVSGATPIVSQERLLVEWSRAFRTNLWAPAPDGTQFLVASMDASGERAGALEAIFNWTLLEEWR